MNNLHSVVFDILVYLVFSFISVHSAKSHGLSRQVLGTDGQTLEDHGAQAPQSVYIGDRRGQELQTGQQDERDLQHWSYKGRLH